MRLGIIKATLLAAASVALLGSVPASAQDEGMHHRMMRHEMRREMRHHMMHRMMRHEMRREMRHRMMRHMMHERSY
jgi:hypothetical protein